MKSSHYILLGIISIFYISCKKDHSTPVKFEKHFGGTGNDKAHDALILHDALYLFGSTKSFDDANGDFYLLKLDMQGKLIFEKTYGGIAEEEGIDIIATNDGNLLLLGSTESKGNGMKDFYAIKINEQGDILWDTTIGGGLNDKPADAIETYDGKFCLAGYTESAGAGSLDVYLVWLDQSGNVIREKTHGGEDIDGSSELIQLEDNNLMLFGFTKNFWATSRDFMLQKMDSEGELLWRKRYGGEAYEESQGFVHTKEGDFILNGHSSSSDPNHDLFVVKVDANGDEIWNKHYGGSMHDGGQAILINSEGNYVCVARSMSFGSGDRNIYMLTSDPDGNTISEDIIGGAKNDWGNKILEYDSYYYIAGHSNSFGREDDDAYLVRIRK